MKNIKPPKYAVEALRRLERRGYEAYLVGGCVRDTVLGRRPNDWDVCTDARPQEIMNIFHSSRPTGIRHGTVTIRVRGSCLEVTTFRDDGEYLDHRRPDSVSFIRDLMGDLKRRDFTVNAMAMSADGVIIDPLGGLVDAKAHIIRCVGNPDRRFSEDALRMLRALRFSSALGFDIESETIASIRRNSALCGSLAMERVAVELEKTLLSQRPQGAETMAELGLLRSVGQIRPGVCDFSAIALLPRDRRLRWGAACALWERSGVITDPRALLCSLRLDAATVKICSSGCEAARSYPDSALGIKRLVVSLGRDAALCAAAAADTLYGGDRLAALRRILRSGGCLSLKELAVNGAELQAMGFEGTEIGRVLMLLLDQVLEHPENNKKDLLLSLAENCR